MKETRDPLAELRRTVAEAAAGLDDGNGGGVEPTLERPPNVEFGDYSTNAAMLLAPALGEQPRGVAERLAEALTQRLDPDLGKVEVAGPGFLNLFLADSWYREAVASLHVAGEEIGRVSIGAERVLVEFVSANPTGPLTAAGGRHAAYGDSLARVLEWSGHPVEREYYVNDVGAQVDLFGASIAARMSGDDVPEGGYEGDYVADLADRLRDEGVAAGDRESLTKRGAELMIGAIRDTLERFGVDFDTWFSERSLHDAGKLDQALEALRETGHVYEHEGATWLRTTEFGDDKDRVLVRSGGQPTYYLADIAYHHDKLSRGFDRLVNVLGADHHGYVGRMRAALAALGDDPDRLETRIMQLVHVVDSGERAQMSKRKGEFVTLDELIDDIGADAARFFMLQRSHDTPVDLDLELARKQSNENPVYYVQYAHARIASILRKGGEEKVSAALGSDPSAADGELEPAERDLVKRLLELPGEVAEAAERRAPHRLCAYAMATAADFHAFYRDCKVIGAEGKGVEEARIVLCVLAKRTLATTLGLLGISAPERM